MSIKEEAKNILTLVGNQENVSSLSHCVTRLRFVLKDESIAETEQIKKINGVKGVMQQGGQYQIIIGKEVDQFFDELQAILGNTVEEEEAAETKKLSLWDRFAATVSGIFTPLLGVLAACGILKGLLTAALVFGIVDEKMGVYIVLYAIAESIFYFFPILLGAAAAEKFGINRYLGMIIGASMIYPSIIDAAGTKGFTFLHLPMNIQDYTSTVFPVIIAAYAASLIHNLFKKICPKVIQFFAVPLVTAVITIPLSLMIIGPVVNSISEFLSTVMNAAYDFSPVLCAILLGGPWLVLVMFGLHWAFIPLFISQLTLTGSVPMMGLLGANQTAVAGALFAVAIRSKLKPEFKSLGISTSITALLGVSEPGIYGVLLPLKKPFIAAIIAGSIGAIPSAIMGTKVYTLGSSGIFAIPTYINPAGIDSGFYGIILSMVVGLVLGFVLTYFFAVPKEQPEIG